MGRTIGTQLIHDQPPGTWETVVFDWHNYTPPPLNKIDPRDLEYAFRTAYDNAITQGSALGSAINAYQYSHVHLIGHSAGAKLIDTAAKTIQTNVQRPFLHLTFLDAYARLDADKLHYGYLATEHFSEHYVDLTRQGLLCNLVFAPTNIPLDAAFNFDITKWKPTTGDKKGLCGHQWPRYWYEKSVTSADFRLGYNLSLEGGKFTEFPKYTPGNTCVLSEPGDCE